MSLQSQPRASAMCLSETIKFLRFDIDKKVKTMSVRHSMWVALIGITLVACGRAPEAPPPPQAMSVTVIEMQPSSVPISAEAVAQTEGAREVEIRPRVGGILLKKLFEEGAPIKAGQAMFLIDPVPYQIALANAKAQLAQMQARIDQTSREAMRLKGLLATQSISQREYDNAVSDNSVAAASLQQGQALVREAELNLSFTTVTAPNSGIAGRFELSEGALVEANNSLLTTLVQISPIWVRFSLSEAELSQLGGRLTEQNVKKVTLLLSDGTEYKQTGKLNFAASSIDPSLGTQELRATFENQDKSLLPGQFVRARVTTGEKNGVFVVPQTAVLTNDLGKFVYVVNEKNEATVVPVKVGNWVGQDWVILSGLSVGDKVIIDNLIKLRPNSSVAPKAKGGVPGGTPAANEQSALEEKPAT
jgi:membrane fusion protein, multidrug efflux system